MTLHFQDVFDLYLASVREEFAVFSKASIALILVLSISANSLANQLFFKISRRAPDPSRPSADDDVDQLLHGLGLHADDRPSLAFCTKALPASLRRMLLKE